MEGLKGEMAEFKRMLCSQAQVRAKSPERRDGRSEREAPPSSPQSSKRGKIERMEVEDFPPLHPPRTRRGGRNKEVSLPRPGTLGGQVQREEPRAEDQVGDMMSAQFAALEERLLPERSFRPQLGTRSAAGEVARPPDRPNGKAAGGRLRPLPRWEGRRCLGRHRPKRRWGEGEGQGPSQQEPSPSSEEAGEGAARSASTAGVYADGMD